MSHKIESLHRLTPHTVNSCTESHIILSPPYRENGEDYSVFKIFQNTGDALFVTDDYDCGITLKLEGVYTEIEELVPVLEYDLQNKIELCNIKIVKVMKNLPSIVSLERLEKFPNSILFKDYSELKVKE
jgi:hypothetical protein